MVASERKATNRPSPEIAGSSEPLFPLVPLTPLARLTRVVVFAWRSRTNTLPVVLFASGDRFEANDAKATKRPSAEIAPSKETPFPGAPFAPAARLTSDVVFVCRSRTSTLPLVSGSVGARFEA